MFFLIRAYLRLSAAYLFSKIENFLAGSSESCYKALQ